MISKRTRKSSLNILAAAGRLLTVTLTAALFSVALAGRVGAQTVTLPDVELFTQDGEKVRFYTDLIKGKVVAVNVIFTSCSYICPMQGAAFKKLQAALGDRLGREVHLVSISTDPANDTPEKLKRWGETFGLKKGWTLVTGAQADIDRVFEALPGVAAGKGDHSPVVFITDGRRWVRAYSLASPERYIEQFDQLLGESSAK